MDDLLHQGIIAYKAGKRDEARNIFITAVKQSPDDELAWGWMYQVSVDDKERIYCLKQMLRINPKNEKAKQMLDTLAGQDFPFEPAQKNNVTPVAQTENTQKQSDTDLHALDANHWYIEGKQLCDLEDYEEAIRCFENALQLEPQYAYAWHEKAFCEENFGRTIDAIHSYKQVLEFADDEPGLIQSTVARLAELEKDQKPSINLKENIGSQNPQTDREITEQRADTTYQPGDVIGQKYEVHSVLGMGGFGVVYLVYDRQLALAVALKTFRDEFLTDKKIRELFQKEASVLVELERHPNLVRAYHVEEISGRFFIVMEYIAPNEQGINSLAGYLQDRPPELAQSLRWAIQICFGMEYVYSKGIRTHRDLKPENIMISQDGTAKITDFGLAGILDSLPAKSIKLTGNVGQFGKTQVGVGFGTPTHMPPEQFIDAASCDVRSDIYAFGVVLFQMASGGEPPFLATPPRDGTREETMRFRLEMQQLHNEAPVPRLNSPLFPIIQRCLEKKPDKRYQSFVQLRSDLEPILKQHNGEVINLPQLGELRVEELNSKGTSLYTLGRYEDAIRYFDQALEIDPRNVAVLSNKGNCLDSLGRYEEAIRYYDISLEIDPCNADALNNKGNCLKNLDRYEEAIRYYDKALEIDQRNVVVLSNKGNCLKILGQYEECLRYYDKALEIDPHYVFALNKKGDLFDSTGRYEEAIRYYDISLEIDPCNADALNNKSSCLNILGRYEEAISCFDQALEFDPNNVVTWYNKGNCLNKLGSYEESIHCYNRALEIDPRCVTALENKAASLGGLGYYEEAIRCCDKALGLDPRSVMALANKGTCLDCLGRYEDALHCFDHALELDPRNVLALGNKSASLTRLGFYEEAIRYCDKTLEIDPGNLVALDNKGASLDHLDRYEESIYCYEQALKIDPRNMIALGGKGICLNNLGRYEEAIRYYDKVLEIDPRNVNAIASKGNSLYSLARYEEATRYYDKVLEIDPRDEGALNNKGICLNSLGRYEESIRYYDKVLEIDPRGVSALNNKANSLGSLGRYEEAIRCCDKALEIDPGYLGSLFNKAFCLDSLGRKREAVQFYRQFLVIAPAQQVKQIEHAHQRIREIDEENEPSPDLFETNWIHNAPRTMIFSPRHEDAFAAFLCTRSLSEMRTLVKKYPFMTSGEFIHSIDQYINIIKNSNYKQIEESLYERLDGLKKSERNNNVLSTKP